MYITQPDTLYLKHGGGRGRERGRERDRVCMCVCERERERERECMCVCVCDRERERERERERGELHMQGGREHWPTHITLLYPHSNRYAMGNPVSPPSNMHVYHQGAGSRYM